MNRIVKLLVLTAICSAVYSCGESEEEKRQREEREAAKKALGGALGSLVKLGETMGKAAKVSQDKQEARRAKGDTIAMPYTELQKYLPVIDGYTMGEPDGGSVNMTGMSYSNAEARYKNAEGKKIKISIIDYNQAFALYSAATAMWAMGLKVDNKNESSGSFKVGERIGGWESYRKKSRKATVTIGVGDRFWINVEADDQDNCEFAKEIATKIDLSKLEAS